MTGETCCAGSSEEGEAEATIMMPPSMSPSPVGGTPLAVKQKEASLHRGVNCGAARRQNPWKRRPRGHRRSHERGVSLLQPHDGRQLHTVVVHIKSDTTRAKHTAEYTQQVEQTVELITKKPPIAPRTLPSRVAPKSRMQMLQY